MEIPLNASLQQLFDQVRGAWRFRWYAIITAAVMAAVGWCVVFALPDRYEAVTQVIVDSRTALKPALQGLTNGTDLGAAIDSIRTSLLVDEQLCAVAQRAGLLSDCDRNPAASLNALAVIRKKVNFDMQDLSGGGYGAPAAGTMISIAYRDPSRDRAQKMVEGLLEQLRTLMLGGTVKGSEQAQQFLESQLQDYQAHLKAAEDKLAAFKTEHLGMLPSGDGGDGTGGSGGYFSDLQKEQQAVEDTRTKLAMTENRRATLQGQLHGNAAVLASAAGSGRQGGMDAPLDTVSQIAMVQARLDGLLLRFTDRHPDVIAARAELAALKERRAEEIKSLRSGDAAAAAATGAASNPVFQSIQLALNQSDVDIADLRTQMAQHESKVAELKRLLNTAPQVEAQYAQLSRDYDVEKAQYAALRASYDKSRLGQRADEAGSIRFQVLQPPLAGFKPVWPRRTVLLLGIFVLALGAGGALAYGLDQLHPVVGSAAGVSRLTGLPVLAQVGPAFPAATQREMRREIRHVSFAVAVLASLLVVGIGISLAGVRIDTAALTHMVQK